jgi:hypothetical protein
MGCRPVLPRPDDPAVEDWVAVQALAVLAGRARQVTASITAQASRHGLTGSQRAGAETCVRYLTTRSTCATTKHPPPAGRSPPASSKGAARRLIGDRLDIAGSWWGIEGAEAILRLRAVIDNGDFETYWAFHLRREHDRVHQTRDQHGYDLIA